MEELLTAVRQVAADHTFLAPQICGSVVDGYVNDLSCNDRPSSAALTDRELEVLRSIADGKSTKTIARELSLSTKTIEWHRSRLMRKLAIENTAGLVRYAMAQGLTTVELTPAGAS